MADPWSLKEEPLSPHQAASHLHLYFSKGNHNGNLQDALPRPAYRFSTATQTKALQLLAAFAAISAVAFLAYICSTYIRRRKPSHSIGRKLAAGEDGEKNDKPESCNPAPEDPYSTVNPGSHASSPAEPEQTELATPPSAPRTDPASTAQIPAAAIPQLGTGGEQRGVKRKERADASKDSGTKVPRLDTSRPVTLLELLAAPRGAAAGPPTSLPTRKSEETPPEAGGPSPDDWLSSPSDDEDKEAEQQQHVGERRWQPSASPSTSRYGRAQFEVTGRGQVPFPDEGEEEPLDLSLPSSRRRAESAFYEASFQRPAEAWFPAHVPGPSGAPAYAAAEGEPHPSSLRSLLEPAPAPTIAEEGMLFNLLQMGMLAERAEAAVDELTNSFEWLRDMLKGVSDEMLQAHPFFRYPKTDLGIISRIFDERRARLFRPFHQKVVSMLSMNREMFKMQRLSATEGNILMDNMERLCGYATGIMPTSATAKSAVERLGRAFFIIDSLYCSAEVLGRSARKHVWWPWIANHIKRLVHCPQQRKSGDGGNTWCFPIVKGLNAALDYYRRGRRPPARLVVTLKLALVTAPKATEFRDRKWDPWRKDAKDWHFANLQSPEKSDESDKE
ncbi:LOW QUALITY PROTEIN: uncharacterized protein EMH_0062670 [Eimeria mitis]|uniref:Transmembrane protein n=1 Tax=Eimeria mitis TaxID=44415 RepID=U6KIK9_9EIME|nr:LOW QUALITY PROTEIN: uncharacterized protein EMH_0062670 [Eimeria mitis]CDJ36102.1 hypothetical protein, conserved [Eimeria mitis]